MDTLKQSSFQYYLVYGLSIFSRRRWLFFIPFFIGLCGATGISFLLPEVYVSSITVLIEGEQVINPLTKGLGVSSKMDERLRTLRQGILSRPLIEKVAKKLDLDTKAGTPEKFEDLVRRIQNKLTITIKGKDLFTVSYEDKDPVRVKDVVNTLTDMYIEENLSVKRSETYAAYDFINDQLQLYKKKLEESEKALREFKEANLKDLNYSQVVRVQGGSESADTQAGTSVGGLLEAKSQNANVAKLEQYQSSLADVELALKEAYDKMATIKKQLEVEEPMLVTAMPGAAEEALDPRLGELQGQLAKLLTQYTEQHPDVIRLRSQIEELKKTWKPLPPGTKTEVLEKAASNPIYQNLRQELEKLQTETSSLEKRRSDLQKQVEVYTLKVKSIPRLEQEYTRLTRDYKVNEDIYQKLLSRLEEARISRDLEVKEKGSTFKVIEPAVLPLFPAKPNRLLIILIGLVGGLGAGLGAIVLMELHYRPFNDQREAEAYLRVPMLGAIPFITTEEDIKRRRRSNWLMASLCALYLFTTAGTMAWQTLKANPVYFQALIQKVQNLPVIARETLKR